MLGLTVTQPSLTAASASPGQASATGATRPHLVQGTTTISPIAGKYSLHSSAAGAFAAAGAGAGSGLATYRGGCGLVATCAGSAPVDAVVGRTGLGWTLAAKTCTPSQFTGRGSVPEVTPHPLLV